MDRTGKSTDMSGCKWMFFTQPNLIKWSVDSSLIGKTLLLNSAECGKLLHGRCISLNRMPLTQSKVRPEWLWMCNASQSMPLTVAHWWLFKPSKVLACFKWQKYSTENIFPCLQKHAKVSILTLTPKRFIIARDFYLVWLLFHSLPLSTPRLLYCNGKF